MKPGLDYDAAVKRAATDQGLDPIIDGLARIGITAVAEQTGGFCMVACVYAADGQYLGVTDACDWNGGPGYLLCEYAIGPDNYCTEGAMVGENVSLGTVGELAAYFLAQHGGPAD